MTTPGIVPAAPSIVYRGRTAYALVQVDSDTGGVGATLSGVPPGVAVTFPRSANPLSFFDWGAHLGVLIALDVPADFAADALGFTVQMSIARQPYPIPLSFAVADMPGTDPFAGTLRQFVSSIQAAKPKTVPGDGSESGFWYYDGARGSYAFAGLANDSSWFDVGDQTADFYLANKVEDWQIAGGYEVHARGLAQYALRRPDQRAGVQAALQKLYDQSQFGKSTPAPDGFLSPGHVRETAYQLELALVMKSLGLTNDRAGVLAEVLLGHLDQCYIGKSYPGVIPYMTGLAADSLIYYYETADPDPRIPLYLKAAADDLRANYWKAGGGFLYEKDGDPSPQPKLNLLLCPLWWWLFKHFGESSFRDFGDAVFAAGAAAPVDQGKELSQRLRWCAGALAAGWREGRGNG